jgi:hypothetical protein
MALKSLNVFGQLVQEYADINCNCCSMKIAGRCLFF